MAATTTTTPHSVNNTQIRGVTHYNNNRNNSSINNNNVNNERINNDK
jgi:hypothetical protein